MKITVTQKHIDEGQRGSSTRDPVCFAMTDAGLKRPYAGVTYLSWADGFAKVPEEVYGFMLDFDNGRPVLPFTFDLESE
jgi:hypothetical protein